MAQLVYPLNIESEATHAVLFSINRIEPAEAKQPHRVIENGLGAAKVIGNPRGDTPIIYESGSGSRTHHTINQADGVSLTSRIKKTWNNIRGNNSSPTEADLDLDRDIVKQSYSRISDSIILQMPNEKTVSYGVEWRQSELGKASRAVQMGYNATAGNFKGVANQAAEVFDIKKAASSLAQSVTDYNFRDLQEFVSGKVLNPVIETLFQGVTNQNYPLSFTFYPKSAKEAKVVDEIFRQFEFHAHPELVSDLSPYYLYPSTFDITFLLDDMSENKWMYQTSTCALTSITITDSEASHPDGSPIIRELSLNFLDLEQKHKGRFT